MQVQVQVGKQGQVRDRECCKTSWRGGNVHVQVQMPVQVQVREEVQVQDRGKDRGEEQHLVGAPLHSSNEEALAPSSGPGQLTDLQ